MSISDQRLGLLTEGSLGDLVQQLYDGIIDDVPSPLEVEALLEIVKLITANYSSSERYPALIEEIYHHLKSDFMQFGLVEVPSSKS